MMEIIDLCYDNLDSIICPYLSKHRKLRAFFRGHFLYKFFISGHSTMKVDNNENEQKKLRKLTFLINAHLRKGRLMTFNGRLLIFSSFFFALVAIASLFLAYRDIITL